MGEENAALRIQATMTRMRARFQDPEKFIGWVIASYLKKLFLLSALPLFLFCFEWVMARHGAALRCAVQNRAAS